MTENVLLVGGTGNLGSSLIQHYVNNQNKDVKLLLADKNFSKAKELADQTNNSCGYKLVHPYKVDIMNPGSIEGLARNINTDHGSLTHLTNIVGGIVPKEINPEKRHYWFEENQPSDEVINNCLQYNLAGSIRLIRDFLPILKQDPNSDKSITLISSINAIQNWAGPTYSAAKAGLTGLVNSSVSPLGKEGIRINSILFGTIVSPRTYEQHKGVDIMEKFTALKRFPTFEEASKEIYLLMHDRSSVTGTNMVVDCGESKITIFSQTETGAVSPKDW
ncbi:MAG: SDR family oxidoreductase [archaeon]